VAQRIVRTASEGVTDFYAMVSAAVDEGRERNDRKAQQPSVRLASRLCGDGRIYTERVDAPG
jgi:hypothetical protein